MSASLNLALSKLSLVTTAGFLATFLLSCFSVNGQQVELFRDINFSGGSLQYGPGARVACMDLTQRNTSFWGYFVDNGAAVRNDEVSSVRVPNGLKITCYEHCDFQGKSLVFTSDCSNMVPLNFNDVISSFVVEGNSAPPQPMKSGSLIFKNNTSTTLYFYYVLTDNNAVINFCYQRQLYITLTSGATITFTIPAGKILNYYFYTSQECDGRYQKFYGVIPSSYANGGLIPIN